MLAVTVMVVKATVTVIICGSPHSLGQQVISGVGMLASGMTVLVCVTMMTLLLSSVAGAEVDSGLAPASEDAGDDGVAVEAMGAIDDEPVPEEPAAPHPEVLLLIV
jgi:hypothetical protein